jgi:hypothetical protein
MSFFPETSTTELFQKELIPDKEINLVKVQVAAHRCAAQTKVSFADSIKERMIQQEYYNTDFE